MAPTLDAALADADVILLLVKHTEFVNLDPGEVASRTNARIIVDCVNAWNAEKWAQEGFTVYRLGVNKSSI
jgi:UDPglucose 6-dehydrogenase